MPKISDRPLKFVQPSYFTPLLRDKLSTGNAATTYKIDWEQTMPKFLWLDTLTRISTALVDEVQLAGKKSEIETLSNRLENINTLFDLISGKKVQLNKDRETEFSDFITYTEILQITDLFFPGCQPAALDLAKIKVMFNMQSGNFERDTSKAGLLECLGKLKILFNASFPELGFLPEMYPEKEFDLDKSLEKLNDLLEGHSISFNKGERGFIFTAVHLAKTHLIKESYASVFMGENENLETGHMLELNNLNIKENSQIFVPSEIDSLLAFIWRGSST